MNKQLVKKK